MSEKAVSQRPYLLRAMHEWMTDSGQTPHIVVNAEADDLDVPSQHVQDGKIILNISFAAVQHLDLGNEEICFEARFGGSPHRVRVPVSAVLGIYARETSQGIVFADEETANPDDGAPIERGDAGLKDPGLKDIGPKDTELKNTGPKKESGPESGRPHLKIIK